MRLLNAAMLVISEFYVNVPPYAILSHTWGEDEVTFTDMVADTKPVAKYGYRKIIRCCEQAISDGLEFVWIDACCIDKRSSAELSEAINSMFSWYEQATICYVYLRDFERTGDNQSHDWILSASQVADFKKSRWFTRGWTLQELLAPALVVFYDADWVEIGTRDELRDVVAEVTKIAPQVYLAGWRHEFSVAQKMSWASGRLTTRVEDQAYCLLGIFGVNMPLLYGEGDKAFMRLQEEIMRTSDDQSIFAWRRLPEDWGSLKHVIWDKKIGLIAPTPALFLDSGLIIRCESDAVPAYHTSNKGLEMSLPILSAKHALPLVPGQNEQFACELRVRRTLSPTDRIAVLNCRFSWIPNSRLAIFGTSNTCGDLLPRPPLSRPCLRPGPGHPRSWRAASHCLSNPLLLRTLVPQSEEKAPNSQISSKITVQLHLSQGHSGPSSGINKQPVRSRYLGRQDRSFSARRISAYSSAMTKPHLH
ncbi:heterokaryon incompatibility protein-domain-containing protein [Xylariaceae sp. FL1272]|nr:heterokaryon incompatibility protein-domain-containing protein [Xylariaceae sp. FL1272]